MRRAQSVDSHGHVVNQFYVRRGKVKWRLAVFYYVINLAATTANRLYCRNAEGRTPLMKQAKPQVPQTLASSRRRYQGVSKSFQTGRVERELQIVQLSATRCSYIAILWVSLVSFAAITLCVASQRVFIVVVVVVVYFVINSVRKLLDTPSYDMCVPVTTSRRNLELELKH
jgi:hypothetical protein